MSLRDDEPGAWHPPELKTEATSGAGVEELVAMLDAFGDHLHPAGEARRREWAAVRLRQIVMRRARWRRIRATVRRCEPPWERRSSRWRATTWIPIARSTRCFRNCHESQTGSQRHRSSEHRRGAVVL